MTVYLIVHKPTVTSTVLTNRPVMAENLLLIRHKVRKVELFTFLGNSGLANTNIFKLWLTESETDEKYGNSHFQKSIWILYSSVLI